jgi:hypothetical protein
MDRIKQHHHDRLRSLCGRNPDFYDFCLELANEAATLAESRIRDNSWGLTLRARIDERIRSFQKNDLASGPEAVLLLRIAHCIVFEDADNGMLQSIVQWNELPFRHTDSFYIGMVPSGRCHVFVTQSSPSQWYLEVSYGFRELLGETVIVFWESFHKRGVPNPAAYIDDSIHRILTNQLLLPYPGVADANASATGRLALLAKMFVYSHEIGHVKARKEGMSFSNPVDEEYFADRIGLELYISSAMMILPPFEKFVLSGRVKNAAERRTMMLGDPIFQKFMMQCAKSEASEAVDASVLSQSELYASETELKDSGFWNGMMWAAPLLVFCLLERFEKATDAVGIENSRATHPPVRSRIEQFLAAHPDKRLRQWIESQVVPALDKVFSPA